MKVVLPARGEGTRMREETEFRPKPMVMIRDQPILFHGGVAGRSLRAPYVAALAAYTGAE